MAAQEIPFGATEQLGFSELLQVLSLRGRSGRLVLSGDNGQAMLLFADGRVVGGDLLPPIQTTDLAALPAQARSEAIEADIQRVLIEVLGWQAGRAAFHEGDQPPPAEASFDVDRLLIGAVRTLDEWQTIGNTLPSAGDCLIWMETRPAATTATPLTSLQRAILPLCNGRLSLAEVARRVHAVDLDVLRAAHDLLERRYVRPNVEVGDSQVDIEAESALTRAAIDLQVRTAAVQTLHQRDRQVQAVTAVVVDAINALLEVLRGPDAASAGEARVWLSAAVTELQAQYGALELVSVTRQGLNVGDLLTAYSSVSGAARDAFYGEAVDGLYDLLLRLAVYLVEERVNGRPAAERVRSTLGALLLEIETAIQFARLSATPTRGAGLSALRRQHFHLMV